MVNTYPRVCVYAGSDVIYLRTFSSTFNQSFNGAAWQFNDIGLQPQEFHGFTDTVNTIPIGYWANIFDSSLPAGFMNVQLGNIAVGNENDLQMFPPPWHAGKVQGWACGVVNTTFVWTFSQGAPLSPVNRTGPFVVNGGFNIGAGAGNLAPAPFSGFNLIVPNGLQMSYERGFLRSYNIVNDNNITQSRSGLDLNLTSSTATVVSAIPFDGLSCCQLRPASPANLYFMLTDWLTFGNQYTITFTNPAGANFDMNTLFPTLGDLPTATYAGFLLPSKSTITYEGSTITGWMMLISPDYSSYRLIKVIPVDTNAMNWTGLTGTWKAKLDSAGVAWFHNQNFSNIILQSGGSVLKSLPIFPPVPLPESSDSDLLARMMRADIP